jgi:acylphosphatase
MIILSNTSEKVQGEAQGPDSAIEDLLKDLQRGTSSSQVSKVEHSDIDADESETGFHVRS